MYDYGKEWPQERPPKNLKKDARKFSPTQPVCMKCHVKEFRQRAPYGKTTVVDEEFCCFCGNSSQRVIYTIVNVKHVDHPTRLVEE